MHKKIGREEEEERLSCHRKINVSCLNKQADRQTASEHLMPQERLQKQEEDDDIFPQKNETPWNCNQ